MPFAHSQGFPLHSQHRSRRGPRRAAWVERPADGPGLLSGPAFWIGGLLSVGLWTLLVVALRQFF